MKLSKYIVSVADHPEKGSTLLFNIFNGKAIVLPNAKFKAVRELPKTAPRWFRLNTPMNTFLKNNFFVSSDAAERADIVSDLQKLSNNQRRISLSVLTTTDCNMACPYCHEGLNKMKSKMEAPVVSGIADIVLKHLISQQTKEVWLYFYGGEPLLNPEPMEFLVGKLNKQLPIALGRIKIIQDMSTNGLLLTRTMAKRLNSFGLNTAQITLDGPPAVHDKRRCLKNGGETFWTIIGNIKNVFDLMHITIRINIDYRNVDSVFELLTILKNERLLRRVRIYADFVTHTLDGSGYCKRNVISDLNDKRKLVDIWRIFAHFGIALPGLKFTEGMCGNLGVNSLAIDPRGNIYSCIGFVGMEKFAFGNIRNFNSSQDKIKQNKCKSFLACLNCKYLPVCGGGCRVQAYLENKNSSGISCNKEFFDYAYPEFLRIKFKAKGNNRKDYNNYYAKKNYCSNRKLS